MTDLSGALVSLTPIQDARWQQAMQAIRDAMRVTGSKSYIRFWMRETFDAPRVAVTIDLANA